MININELRLLVQDYKLAGSPVFVQAADMNEILDRLEAAEKENTKLREALAQKVTGETMLRDLSVGNGSINAEQSEISASISLNKLSVKQLKDLLNKMDDSIQLSFTDLKIYFGG
jgi:tetrahydromethanopterin S-methyltransferase subunit G